MVLLDVPDPLGCPLLRRWASGIFRSLAPYHCLSPLNADLFSLGPRAAGKPISLSSVRQALRLDPELAARFCASARQALTAAAPDTVSDLVPRLTLLCLPALVRAHS